MIYKAIKAKPLNTAPKEFKGQCTGCIRDTKHFTDCTKFIEERVSEGLGNCCDGIIYVEVTK